MAKLEEISELLVSEIRDFEEAVKKLEKIQDQKIRIDSRSLEQLFKDHQEMVKEVLVDHSREMKNLGKDLAKAKAFPLWALTTFTISLIVNGILIYILIGYI
jgi:hypothetical protein